MFLLHICASDFLSHFWPNFRCRPSIQNPLLHMLNTKLVGYFRDFSHWMGTNSNLTAVSLWGESAHFLLGCEEVRKCPGRPCLGVREARATTVDYRAFKERKKKKTKRRRRAVWKWIFKIFNNLLSKGSDRWTRAINNQWHGVCPA